MDFCRSCSCSGSRRRHRACLAPSFWPLPLFPRIRIWVDSAPGAWQGVGPLLASLLSLSIHCAPRATPTRSVPCVCAANEPLPAHFRTLLSLVVAPCAPGQPSAPRGHLSSPLPSLTLQPPGCVLQSRPPYFTSLLFVRGGPGSVTCAALYGAVCKNKPIGILVSRFLPDPPPRPDPELGLPRRGRNVGWWGTDAGGLFSPEGPRPLTRHLFSLSVSKRCRPGAGEEGRRVQRGQHRQRPGHPHQAGQHSVSSRPGCGSPSPGRP